MGEKVIVGPINKGLRNDRTAFVIDNDAFPTLLNAYQWRGRVKRKRGTAFLGRLTRLFDSSKTSYNPAAMTITLGSAGDGNLLTGFNLQTAGNIVPGTVTIIVTAGGTYTDPSKNGTLAPSGTINYATGYFTTAAGESGKVANAKFNYNPDLPVMGLRDLILSGSQYPNNLAFDTTYSYNVTTNTPANIYDVSFYKNPASTTYNGIAYTQKTDPTPTTWNGQDYQQFWTVNYQGALWATNGTNVPFSPTSVGMQFQAPESPTHVLANNSVDFRIDNCPLVVGDWVFANEFVGPSADADDTLNFQTGFVTSVVAGSPAIVTVKFPWANITLGDYSNGILQYLTNRSDTTKDCLRWYDGDPTDGTQPFPSLTPGKGWVNFAPPLSHLSFSIAETPQAQYYLVGAKMIVPFKDRILFIGPVVQTSSVNSQIYLQDTIVYSQNGTPYYTASFNGTTGGPASPTTVFHSLLVPVNQTATASSYFSDVTGFGGFVSSGIDQSINTVGVNQDALILGMQYQQSRLIYSGNDIVPFQFFTINSELGSGATFSAITMDQGVLALGTRGATVTSQTECARFDLEIPDQIFEFRLTNNGSERITAHRDFINEWVYFSYPANNINYNFPTQTLQYNYRDRSWGIFDESYTCYGTFRGTEGLTWATVGQFYPTWSAWTVPWNSSATTTLQPQIIGGNQQGFVMMRAQGTGEGTSLEIGNISFPVSITGATNAVTCVLTATNTFAVGQSVTISGVTGMIQLNGNTYTITAVTPTTISINVDSTAFGVYAGGGTATPSTVVYSPNHCLSEGDYIIITGALGTISSQVNGKIFSVDSPSATGFNLNPSISSGTYLGRGLIQRMYVPQIISKQFPTGWGLARKTRLGPQQYLLTTTDNGEVSLLIFLSQNSEEAYNDGNIVPEPGSINNALIYSTILYTCPESANLGLTAPNTNLLQYNVANADNTTAASQQAQMWHRVNTSLIGDTVQVGISMSDAQMREFSPTIQTATITGASQASQCVVTAANDFAVGQMVYIQNVKGMTELNYNDSQATVYQVVAASSTTFTIDVDSTAFTAYVAAGPNDPVPTATILEMPNQFEEIELHGIILDTNPSQMLA